MDQKKVNEQQKTAEEFGKDFTGEELEELAVNTIRALSMDAVQKASSGHPGLPMGAADFAYVLWMKFLKHAPSDPKWPDRDRFVLSAGHGSMLLYSLLHLFGYELSLDDLKNFRQWGSLTPGHPEYGLTPGVETTTGPLGQGFANGVGMALAERILAGILNDTGSSIVDHYTYALVSDGDIMEGISHEAASLAGHWGLNRIICFYDSNRITIEGSTDLAFSEDVKKRFESYNWHVVEIDGHDRKAIARAIEECQKEKNKPSIIIGHTHIAKGSPNKQDTAGAHGEPLGEEEVEATKKNLGFPPSPTFLVPDAVRELFKKRVSELESGHRKWQEDFSQWSKANPDKRKQWDCFMEKKLPDDLASHLPKFKPGEAIATRNASGTVLQSLGKILPNLVGGSADLAPSTKTIMKDLGSVGRHEFTGRNIHFGIREHGMGSILNGLSVHGGIIPYGATFFVFSDYMRPSLRLAAMMKQPVILVYTHDSIFVGEDGPTHEPVEQLASLRAIPGMIVIRPADAPETAVAWHAALEMREGPTALILSRQKLPVLDRSQGLAPAEGLRQGAYILAGSEIDKPDILLIASGSEVHIALEARRTLAEKGIKSRVVSMASWELFECQPAEYRREVIPPDLKLRLAIEAGITLGWEKYVGDSGEILGINHFGASAPYKTLAKKFGFTAETIVNRAMKMLS